MRSLKGTKILKNISLRKSDWLFGNLVSHGRLPMSKTKVAGEILHCKGIMSFPSIEMELKFASLFHRHPELVSPSVTSCQGLTSSTSKDSKMLKQVQHDDFTFGDLVPASIAQPRRRLD
jgi:hypothetical protein